MDDYERIAKEIRKEILRIIYRAKAPHIGSSFSIVEILVALYFNYLSVSPETAQEGKRDKFILSKGHGCPTLYATLAAKKFFGREVLDRFAIDGGRLEEHPTRNLKFGIEVSTGSLGHGLSMGIGMALAEKYGRTNSKVVVLMSDGELNEGTVWEAAMFAAHHKLNNLIAIIDYNKLQALGKTNEVIKLEPLALKWQAFGWGTKEVDGHNIREIIKILKKVPFKADKPNCLIARTVKGKGVSFMENRVLWHYRCPNATEYARALRELDAK